LTGSFQEAISLISNNDEFLLTGHVNPDGDCLGSVCALGLALEDMGKKVKWVSDVELPAMYSIIPGADRFGRPPLYISEKTTVIALDCAVPARLALAAIDTDIDLNIDHHCSNSMFGRINLVEAEAAATGELVYRLIKALNRPISPRIALALYIAIATDTGFFKYSNTRPYSLNLAGELAEIGGLDMGQVAEIVNERKKFGTIKLLGKALERMQLSADGKVAWMEVTQTQLKKFGTDLEETEGFVNYCRQVEGAEIGVLFKETEHNDVRVSVRSNSNWDVSKLAAHFGGGGHPRAAGCTLAGSLPVARRKFLTYTAKWMQS
jgi:phosphoesterase RecJ-like protein